MKTILDNFNQDLKNANTTKDIELLRVKYLGKKGPIQDLMKGLKDLSKEERPKVGKEINDLKVTIEKALNEKALAFLKKEEQQRLAQEEIDVTLPGRRSFLGRKHLITKVVDDVLEILTEMGFSIQLGPDIESDYYNFEALNFQEDHPARDMQDTFYIDDKVVLRTHTSNVQVRVMENNKPPIRVVAPGKVYRNEAVSARSHVFFHQVEAFYVDKGVSFVDLISTLDEFLKKLYQKEVKTRYRPSYFPFVEPGLEVDIHCASCGGSGCAICKYTGWLEVAGAGMIHPEVLKSGGIDPDQYSGFAWGFGLERLVMTMYGIKDIRLFTQNDMRFLKQFPSV